MATNKTGYSRAWRRTNLERARAIDKRGHLKRYGLTPEDHAQLLEKQDGRCVICRRERTLAIDHDHATGRVRGLLCYACNNGLGAFGDDPERLRAAIAYLQK